MESPNTYAAAPELNGPLSRAINEYHPYLKDAKIACMFRSGNWQVKDAVQLGKAVVAPPAWRSLTGYELLLIVNEALYRSFSDKQKMAQLDHILSYIKEPAAGKHGAYTYSLRDHDIREFSGVVNRHNICFSNLKAIDEHGNRQMQMLESLEEKALEIDALAAEEQCEESEEEDFIEIKEYLNEEELKSDEGTVLKEFKLNR